MHLVQVADTVAKVAADRLVLEIDIRQRLPVVATRHETGGLFFEDQGGGKRR
jgi:hypothetical protein